MLAGSPSLGVCLSMFEVVGSVLSVMPGASAQVGHFWCHRVPPDLRLCGRLAAGAHAPCSDEKLLAELRDLQESSRLRVCRIHVPI